MVSNPEVTRLVEEWRADLEALYLRIKGWLSEAEIRAANSGLGVPPSIEVRPITLNEERSGPYDVNELILTHTGRSMKVHPVARWIVGADGRVDLRGTEGPFILVNLKQGAGWNLVPDSPTRDPVPLTGDLFRQLALACLR